jgi:hypothetical protein
MSMFVFIPGLSQHVAMIPDPDDQGTQPQWTMIIVGKCFLVNSEMLGLILQPLHRKSAQEKLFPFDLRLTIDQLLPIRRIPVGWKRQPVYPITNSSN